MQKNNTSHWTDYSSLEGLLYFAQRFNESLFDYTIDTFKPRVLNTSILVFEAMSVYSDVKSDKIDAKNLDYVIDELNWSFQKDKVAKKILGNEREIYFPLVDSGKKDDLKLKLELLQKKLSAKKYLEVAKDFLSESVIQNKKKDIDEGIGAIISTLKTAGFSQGYLFHQTHKFFFNHSKPIDNINQINDFLNQFALKGHVFSCIFKVSSDFKEISKTYEKFKITILNKDQIANFQATGKQFVETIKEDEVFILCEKVAAFDLNSSRKNAFHLLNKLRDYFAFYHHKEKFIISTECLSKLEHENETEWTLVKCPTSPMKKGVDKKKEKAAKQLEKFLEKADFSPISFRKIDRAIDLHGLSIESTNLENQILNLWISLEMLIPQSTESSKIQQITNTLVPFLTISYLQKLIRYLAQGITNWNYHRARYYLSKVPKDYGNNLLERYTAFICLTEFSDDRNNLMSELDDFPLLRNRLFTFSEILSKPKNIIEFIENHEKKLFWHLRRIYRTRNQIIHDGRKIGYLETLIENGHNYFDTFLNTIIILNLKDKQINSLEQGIKKIELLYAHQNSYLKKNKDSEIVKENYLDMILGEIRHYSQHGI
ncbi:MAG: hypothetical protein ACWA6U_17640 [Breznakibacter sp.]